MIMIPTAEELQILKRNVLRNINFKKPEPGKDNRTMQEIIDNRFYGRYWTE